PDLSDLPCRCRERFGAPAQRTQKSRRLRRCRFRQASRAKKSRGPIMLTRRTFCTSAGCTGAIAGFGLNTGLARADNALGTLDPAFGEMEKKIGGRLGVAVLNTMTGARAGHRSDERQLVRSGTNRPSAISVPKAKLGPITTPCPASARRYKNAGFVEVSGPDTRTVSARPSGP